jgi:hypothetical protein
MRDPRHTRAPPALWHGEARPQSTPQREVPMGEPSQPRANPAAWVAATILLLICIGGSFWVPLYARTAPKLGDFPFF